MDSRHDIPNLAHAILPCTNQALVMYRTAWVNGTVQSYFTRCLRYLIFATNTAEVPKISRLAAKTIKVHIHVTKVNGLKKLNSEKYFPFV